MDIDPKIVVAKQRKGLSYAEIEQQEKAKQDQFSFTLSVDNMTFRVDSNNRRIGLDCSFHNIATIGRRPEIIDDGHTIEKSKLKIDLICDTDIYEQREKFETLGSLSFFAAMDASDDGVFNATDNLVMGWIVEQSETFDFLYKAILSPNDFNISLILSVSGLKRKESWMPEDPIWDTSEVTNLTVRNVEFNCSLSS